MASKQLDDGDIEVVRSSLMLLSDVKDAAQTLEDLNGELPREIMEACVRMRKEMSQIVEAKSMFGAMYDNQEDDDMTIIQITLYLDMIDQIDKSLKDFKEKYVALKQLKMDKIKKKQAKVQLKVEKLISGDTAPKKEEAKKKLDDSGEEEKTAEPIPEETTNEEDKEEEKTEPVESTPSKKFGLSAPPKST